MRIVKAERDVVMSGLKRYMCVAAALAVSSGLSVADSITVEGTTYEDVYVRQGGSMYYVALPDEGRVMSFAKSAVDPEAVVLTEDTSQRAALLRQWEERRIARQETAAPRLDIGDADSNKASAVLAGRGASAAPAVPEQGYGARAQRNPPAGDGVVGRVSLKNVGLGQALKATLRPLNLDYSVQDNFVWISTPEKIRTESFEELETRTYALRGVGASDTLPKIVLRHGPLVAQASSLHSGRGYGAYGDGGRYGRGRGAYGGARTYGRSGSYRTGYGRGYGGYGAGGRSANRLGSGGLRGGWGGTGAYGRGYAGARGGYGYPGGAGGGGGGLYGGFGGPVPHFSNISDLFYTIDDRRVGETPAVIGLSGVQPNP